MNIKQSFRTLFRNKTYSLLNIFGLAIGLTAVLYIAFYVWQESHYDDFHTHGENLYRASVNITQNGNSLGDQAEFVAALAPAMKTEIPEIKTTTRISSPKTINTSYEDKLLKIENVCFADTGFLEMFTFPLLKGNIQTALTVPYSIVLTEKIAENLFGKEDPLGKTILINGSDNYIVTGVAASLPSNSQFKFNALASFSTLYRMTNVHLGWDGGNQYITYAKLNAQSQPDTVARKTNQVIWEHIGKMYAQGGFIMKGSLQPVKDVHLYYNEGSKTLRTNLLIFSVVALLILIIAGINFVNMTTSRSLRRIKEAGVRKVLGAKRPDLVRQFMGESLLITLIAFLISLILFRILKPLYILLIGSPITETSASYGAILGGIFALTLLIGVIAGSYPAFRLSSLTLSDASKGGGSQRLGKHRIQSILIITQFAISVGLIVCTLVVSSQLSFINNKDTGVDRNQIITLSLTSKVDSDHAPLLKQRLKSIPGITAVSGSSDIPSGGFTSNGYMPEGMENPMMIHVVDADEDFLNVYGIHLKAGKFFSDHSDANKSAYIINESLAKTLGWNEDALGKQIARDGAHEVIGIVSDFNYTSFYDEIQPLLITNEPWENRFNTLSIKYNTKDIPALISQIKGVWSEINSNSPFEYNFFDEIFDNQYKSEQQFRTLFFSFAIIAIILAVSGMLSLMAYAIEQRKKEIGIRKVLGASVPNILNLLLRQTVVQILIANVIAWPVAWWFTNKWLDDFAYRIHISWTIFAGALAISAFIALIAVCYQAMTAATANPIKSIKTE